MRIAIPIPTTADLAYNTRSRPAYAEAIRRSGGEPVELGLGLAAAELLAIVETCHGICLPGSPADVDPTLYGQERDPATDPTDPAREATDFALLHHALATGKPVLGICYGMQSMNVWCGGSLVQDLTPLPVNHAAGSKVAIAHAALVAKSSFLGSMLTEAEAPAADDFLRLPINTSHHQAIGAPGDGLRVVARCPDDGVIEAVELVFSIPDDEMFHVEHLVPTAQMLAVQWHPERSFDISAASRALFAWLVAASKTKLNQKLPQS